MEKVDIIIPVYRPDKRLLALLDGLKKQTVPINRIYLINTEQRYFDGFIVGTDFWQAYKM